MHFQVKECITFGKLTFIVICSVIAVASLAFVITWFVPPGTRQGLMVLSQGYTVSVQSSAPAGPP